MSSTTNASTTDTTARAVADRAQIAARTLRTDRWWLPPLATVAGLGAWVVYATVRAFMRQWYFVADYNYLTPFYSPCVSVGCEPAAAHLGRFLPDAWWLPYAAISLPFLLLFRLTCYYYRRSYYRAFWASPPACAVTEPHARYTGETRFPLILQNAHRYFFYAGALIAVINTWDAVAAFVTAEGRFGLGLGNVVLVANVVLLWAYTLSCHSCRNAIAGRLNHFSRHPVRYRLWTYVSRLNARHMQLATTTLVSLAVTDFYVMAVAAGWWADPRIVG